MSRNFLSARQTRYSIYVTLYIAIVLGALGAANWLGNRHNKSFDTTTNKRFSLSDQTIKIVGGLKEDVTISYFDENTRFNAAKDLLDRYDTLSTKLSIEYIDPFKKPQLAKEFGIRTTGTVLIRSAAKRQEARSLTEEEITSALVRLLKPEERVACFASGAGEHSIEETAQLGYSGLKDTLEKNNYKTQSIALLEKPEIPKECGVVLVAGPRYDYPQPVVDALKKHVEGGGRAMFLVDPPLDSGKEKIADNKALVDMLSGWGVTLNRDQVLDTSGVGGLYGLGPEVALGVKYETHPIVREMKGTASAFSIVRSLEVKPSGSVSAEKLVSTSTNSAAITQLSGAARKVDLSKAKTDSFTVAAAGSYRTGQPNVEGRFVVVGSSDWLANYILRFTGNRDLFLNMMNWLSSDEDLISIRPKDPEDRRIQLTRAQMNTLRLTSQFFIPLAVLGLGILVWWRRR